MFFGVGEDGGGVSATYAMHSQCQHQPITDLKFLKNGRQVGTYSAFADVKLFGDGLVAVAQCHELGHFLFTRGQRSSPFWGSDGQTDADIVQ